MIGASFLSGANSRLLPPSLPFRFFTAAVLFFCLFWASVFVHAGDITGYVTGSGPVLAMIHMATLGVLTMTVIGALLQLLSVATRKAFQGFWFMDGFGICRVLSWIYITGFLLLVWAMYSGWYPGMLGGAGLTGLGLLIFFILISRNIWGVQGMGAIMAHCWAAMLSLLALTILGILLIADMEQGFLENHLALANSHFILAVFGFMGLLVMGFSYILVPMFVLAPAPSEGTGRWSVFYNITAIVMLVLGLNLPSFILCLCGVVFAAAGCGYYLFGMVRTYGARMKKRLGIPFLLIKMSWVMQGTSILWAAAGITGYWPETGHTLLANFVIVGWLLTFLTGILHRILPFLASMHISAGGGIPVLASEMADERWLKLNAAGHISGFMLVSAGIFFDAEGVIRTGAAFGFIGGLGLTGYLFSILRHMTGK